MSANLHSAADGNSWIRLVSIQEAVFSITHHEKRSAISLVYERRWYQKYDSQPSNLQFDLSWNHTNMYKQMNVKHRQVFVSVLVFCYCHPSLQGAISQNKDKIKGLGLHPTNEIWSKFEVLWFEIWSTDHNKILHTSWHCYCRDMCKISLWSVEYVTNHSITNFIEFWIW